MLFHYHLLKQSTLPQMSSMFGATDEESEMAWFALLSKEERDKRPDLIFLESLLQHTHVQEVRKENCAYYRHELKPLFDKLGLQVCYPQA